MNENAAGGKTVVEVTIRRAVSIADYRACQEAQRRAWGIDDGGYLVPVATMVGANLHGGLVLGAFMPSGEAVAMSFAFLGQVEGRLCLYSQLTGVVPGYQSRGLGYEIKMAQRALARDQGLERIAWAFDPLQVGNAHFNLVRLGATAVRYIEDMYGRRHRRAQRGRAYRPAGRRMEDYRRTASEQSSGSRQATQPDRAGARCFGAAGGAASLDRDSQ